MKDLLSRVVDLLGNCVMRLEDWKQLKSRQEDDMWTGLFTIKRIFFCGELEITCFDQGVP